MVFNEISLFEFLYYVIIISVWCDIIFDDENLNVKIFVDVILWNVL